MYSMWSCNTRSTNDQREAQIRATSEVERDEMRFIRLPAYKKLKNLEGELKELLPKDEFKFFEGMSDDTMYSQAFLRYGSWLMTRHIKLENKLLDKLK